MESRPTRTTSAWLRVARAAPPPRDPSGVVTAPPSTSSRIEIVLSSARPSTGQAREVSSVRPQTARPVWTASSRAAASRSPAWAWARAARSGSPRAGRRCRGRVRPPAVIRSRCVPWPAWTLSIAPGPGVVAAEPVALPGDDPGEGFAEVAGGGGHGRTRRIRRTRLRCPRRRRDDARPCAVNAAVINDGSIARPDGAIRGGPQNAREPTVRLPLPDQASGRGAGIAAGVLQQWGEWSQDGDPGGGALLPGGTGSGGIPHHEGAFQIEPPDAVPVVREQFDGEPARAEPSTRGRPDRRPPGQREGGRAIRSQRAGQGLRRPGDPQAFGPTADGPLHDLRAGQAGPVQVHASPGSAAALPRCCAPLH